MSSHRNRGDIQFPQSSASEAFLSITPDAKTWQNALPFKEAARWASASVPDLGMLPHSQPEQQPLQRGNLKGSWSGRMDKEPKKSSGWQQLFALGYMYIPKCSFCFKDAPLPTTARSGAICPPLPHPSPPLNQTLLSLVAATWLCTFLHNLFWHAKYKTFLLSLPPPSFRPGASLSTSHGKNPGLNYTEK